YLLVVAIVYLNPRCTEWLYVIRLAKEDIFHWVIVVAIKAQDQLPDGNHAIPRDRNFRFPIRVVRRPGVRRSHRPVPAVTQVFRAEGADRRVDLHGHIMTCGPTLRAPELERFHADVSI